jgi:hypothetical protein
MTLAGWDEKSSLAAAADPKTPAEVLNYMIAPDNLRPALLPALLENPSVPEALIAKLAVSAGRDAIDTLLKSARVRSLATVLQTLKANPYLKKEEVEELKKTAPDKPATAPIALPVAAAAAPAKLETQAATPEAVEKSVDPTEGGDDEAVAAYFNEHASEIAAEGNKPFQAIGGLAELLLSESTEQIAEAPAPEPAPATPAAPARPAAKSNAPPEGKRENTVQKVNRLDVKGRIQLALKGNKEERSLLIRDGTKVVALSVLEAPKLSDGEVEKFASQKNVLEAVLRQIPLKRRFMKNYIVVRNLVANPRTPLDLGLGLMKNLLPGDLKNISANKDVSETIRKLALKMYKQKMEAANKK